MLILYEYIGLPSKPRGTYNSRKRMNEDDRIESMRIQNRDNARRTRKRKKM